MLFEEIFREHMPLQGSFDASSRLAFVATLESAVQDFAGKIEADSGIGSELSDLSDAERALEKISNREVSNIAHTTLLTAHPSCRAYDDASYRTGRCLLTRSRTFVTVNRCTELVHAGWTRSFLARNDVQSSGEGRYPRRTTIESRPWSGSSHSLSWPAACESEQRSSE